MAAAAWSWPCDDVNYTKLYLYELYTCLQPDPKAREDGNRRTFLKCSVTLLITFGEWPVYSAAESAYDSCTVACSSPNAYFKWSIKLPWPKAHSILMLKYPSTGVKWNDSRNNGYCMLNNQSLNQPNINNMCI